MNAEKISPLQLTPLRDLPSGMTESNHLSQAWLTEAERMEGVLAYAFGTTNDTVLSLLTGGIGNTRFISNREYKWDLHGQVRRVAEVSEAVTVSNTPGIGGSVISFKTKDDIFRVTDNIVSDDLSQARINDIKSNGVEYTIYCVLTDPDASKWLDPAQIASGAKWSKDYSTVEEGSVRGGGTDFQAPMTLTNQLTTLRKEYEITRSAATDVMVIELFSPDGGKSTKMWTMLAEWTAMQQWYQEIDNALLYSIYNKDSKGLVRLKGDNGRPVYHGAGLRQQISPGNKRSYMELTYEILDSFLLDLSYNASRWGGDHNFVGLTGKMGMREFDRAIQDKRNAAGITVTDSGTFITGSGEELTFTGYFSTVKFLNGISLTMKEFPPYDDITRNRTLDPVTRKPLESFRITVLNFAYDKNKGYANIRKVAKEKSENIMWYEAGSIHPMGKVNNSLNAMGSNGFDGYKVHIMAEVGLQVQDPTSCGELFKVAANLY